MKVLWTPTSVRHLGDIYHYITRDSPRYASRMIARTEPEAVVVLAVVHGARLLPPELSDADTE